MRRIEHPGPVDAVRIDSLQGAAKSLEFSLAHGVSLLDAIAAPLERAGLSGAGVTFGGVRLGPFRYVVPAFSPDSQHVAYYSATHAPAEDIEIVHANLTYGRKDGMPFLHCHALWRDRAGRARGGHVLPLESFVSTPGPAAAFGTGQAGMDSAFDAETNFTLFRPVAGDAARDPAGKCVLARLRPNVDLIEGVEAVCRRHGIGQAIVRSGVGSIIGAEFDDGREIQLHPTEILVLNGRVATDADGKPRADLAIALIDTHGDIHEGRPARGRNPILICFELVLECE